MKRLNRVARMAFAENEELHYKAIFADLVQTLFREDINLIQPSWLQIPFNEFDRTKIADKYGTVFENFEVAIIIVPFDTYLETSKDGKISVAVNAYNKETNDHYSIIKHFTVQDVTDRETICKKLNRAFRDVDVRFVEITYI